jgi:DNA recombination protein RmuC
MQGKLESLSGETSRLVMSLKGNPKTPGDWGQHHFENLIQLAQLTEHVDYEKERSFETEEGRKRPDFVIRLPEGGRLVVDIKCSLDHYLSARGEVDETRRDAFLNAHAGAVRKHAADLAKKSYYEDVAGSPDYVIMYLPGDHYLAAAMEADPELWRRAADRHVIIASPGTFLPLAHSLASMWRSYKLSEDAQKIGRLGKEMHDRLAVAAEHLRIMGSGLGTAVKNYNKFVGSFERNVMSTGRKFRDLAIEPGAKELSEISLVELQPTYIDGVGIGFEGVDAPPANTDDPPQIAAE